MSIFSLKERRDLISIVCSKEKRMLYQFFVRRGRGSHVVCSKGEGTSCQIFVRREKGSHVNYLFEGGEDLMSNFCSKR